MKSREGWMESGAIVAVWAAAIAFIRPYGEFPLMDDWDFIIPTWRFARTGEFQFTQFTAVSLRAQVVWGALWTRLFGESILVLRLSVATLGGIAIVLVHRILLRVGVPRVGRVIGALALAFNPLFLWSSCTFMTEVPFVCASVAALLLLWRGLEEHRALVLTAGCAAAMIACFVRQTGIVLIVSALAVVLLLREEATPRWRRAAVILFAFAALFGALLLFRPEWLSGTPAEFLYHSRMWRESSFRLPQQLRLAYRYTVLNTHHAAVFFLPLVVPLIWWRWSRARVALLLAAGAAVLFRVQQLLNAGYAMPYFVYAPDEDLFPSLFLNFTVGPAMLIDVWWLRYPYPFGLPPWGQVLFTYFAVAAAALLVSAILIALPRAKLLLVLSVTIIFVSTVALFGSGLYVDRYSLDTAWSLAVALPLIVPWDKRAARTAAVVVLAAVAIFGVFSVQEYFAWNRARWSAFHALRAQGIPVTEIDAGGEAKWWYEISSMSRQEMRRWMQTGKDRQYTLAFHELPGHAVVGRVPFEGWLGWHRGEIKVLRRQSSN